MLQIFRDWQIRTEGKWTEVRIFVNLVIKHWSPSYVDLRINSIPLRYPMVVKLCRDDFNLGIEHWSSNLKIPTLDIEIKCSNLTISTLDIEIKCSNLTISTLDIEIKCSNLTISTQKFRSQIWEWRLYFQFPYISNYHV